MEFRAMRLLLLACVVLLLPACNTQTVRNEELWYNVSLPKTWKTVQPNLFSDGGSDTLRIRRLVDDSELDTSIESTKRSFQQEMANFVMENEELIQLRGYPSWRMIGSYKKEKTNEDTTLFKLIIHAGKYKYILDFQTPSETFKERKPIFDQIIASFAFEIPKY